MTNNNENLAASKKHTITEYFIDKKPINKNITLVDSYYIGIYSMQRQKRFMISLPTITSF
ncbi:hypothetical protein C5Q49_002783 [Salmonella enterica subsp. enterica serovar Mississippi]|uniref:Uncharacterized protein n=2 Tax=Salmonella enterica TaxID=28901 RepID=A0A3X9TYD7_SALET|nr:hypothetical protein [Salmonella enterica]EAB5622445.1 hypothetical protein [Salmonella enterica subsp. enterica serovar Mississippi]EBY7903102.1 hypothetical protein [Salmonella enterica subsp. enterica serovar Enteritidis]ECG5350839.1 hypothetical protein [Salmonella enterica subsp. enterica serovar Tennessee]ECR2652219.1 hypothetical protein [Salmonella enterica subsp. enterica]ECU8003336.1 hypothetical protein [Salmonella enterica subsp. enterica serovar O rough]ECW0241251.1 hypothetic